MPDKPIPPQVLDILARYAMGQGGALTGSTRPLVENDFIRALIPADAATAAALPTVAAWIWNDLPTNAWGSPEKVRAWTMRAQVAAHPDAPRVVRLERDDRERLGADTWQVNRYALAYEGDGDERHEAPLFIECLALVASEATGVLLVEALAKAPAPQDGGRC